MSATYERSAAATTAEKPGSPVVADMDEAQLIEAVRKQVEYYFSKENLQSDAFLTSQMDANMSVAISVVMKFAKLKALTQDESILRKALEGSSLSIVDNRIKANIKSVGRSTIILREIPSDAPQEEVKEIFNYEGCAPVTSIRSDVGDTWFVMMDKEEEAKQTIIDLRVKKRLFRGQSVKARLKTETVVRSFFPVQAAPPPVSQTGMNPYGPMPGMNPYGGMGGSGPNNAMSGMMGPMGPSMPGMGPTGAPIDLRAYNQYLAAMAGNNSMAPQGQVAVGSPNMPVNGQSVAGGVVDQNVMIAAAQAAAVQAAAAAAGMALVVGPDGQLMQQPMNPQQQAQLMQQRPHGFDPNMPQIPGIGEGGEVVHTGPPSGKGGKNRKGNRGGNQQGQQGGHNNHQQQQSGSQHNNSGNHSSAAHESGGGKRRGKSGNSGNANGPEGGGAHNEKGGNRKGGHHGNTAASSTSIEINTLNFPPLGGESGDAAAADKPVSSTPVSNPGYKSAVQKNTVEAVMSSTPPQAAPKVGDEQMSALSGTSVTGPGSSAVASAESKSLVQTEKENSIVDMAIGATSVATTLPQSSTTTKVSTASSTEVQEEIGTDTEFDAGGLSLTSTSADAQISKAPASAPSSWAAMVRSAATSPPPTAAGELAGSGSASATTGVRVVRSIGTNTAANRNAVTTQGGTSGEKRTGTMKEVRGTASQGGTQQATRSRMQPTDKDNKDGRKDRVDRKKTEGGKASSGGGPTSPARTRAEGDALPSQKASSEGPGGMETEEVSNAGSEPVPAMPTSGWGGKTSFANVLKQNSAEENAPPSINSSSSSNATGSNSGGAAATRGRIQQPAARVAPSNTANAPGMWSKESLPAEEHNH